MKSPAEPTTAGLARQKRYGPFARGGTIWETASRKYTAPGELKGEQWHLGWEDTINDAAGFRNSTESPRCASAFRCASVGLNHSFRWAALVPSLPKTPCSSTQTPDSRRSLPDACSRHANCATLWRSDSPPSRLPGRGRRTSSSHPAKLHIRHEPLRCGETREFRSMPSRSHDAGSGGEFRLPPV